MLYLSLTIKTTNCLFAGNPTPLPFECILGDGGKRGYDKGYDVGENGRSIERRLGYDQGKKGLLPVSRIRLDTLPALSTPTQRLWVSYAALPQGFVRTPAELRAQAGSRCCKGAFLPPTGIY